MSNGINGSKSGKTEEPDWDDLTADAVARLRLLRDHEKGTCSLALTHRDRDILRSKLMETIDALVPDRVALDELKSIRPHKHQRD